MRFKPDARYLVKGIECTYANLYAEQITNSNVVNYCFIPNDPELPNMWVDTDKVSTIYTEEERSNV